MSDEETNGDDESETEETQSVRADDPFEQLDRDVAGREGDPFERLGEGPGSQDDEGEPGDPEADSGPDWFENPNVDDPARGRGADSAAGGPRTVDSGEHGPDDPFGQADAGDIGEQPSDEDAVDDQSKMTFDVGRRDTDGATTGPLGDLGTREGDPFEEMGVFEEQEAGGIDPDSVWQELTSAESRGSVGDAQERTFADVSKHSYCEQCEHFSEPPEIHCDHEGTEIVEYLDMETVRVVDCPIVAERRELRKEE